MKRQRIEYGIGNEHNPSNPFGRSELTIEPDGAMRHELFFGTDTAFAWTATVLPDVLDRIWAALERAGFPESPGYAMPPPGATMQCLTIGHDTVDLPLHESGTYGEVFAILGTILREASEGMVKDAQPSATPSVVDVARAAKPERRERERPPPREPEPGISAGTAYLLAYLPARRAAHEAKLAHLATLDDPALEHARKFGGGALKLEGALVADVDTRRAALAREHGVDLANAGASVLSQTAKAAWKAGETARAVAIAAELAAHVAYFRASAPENAALRGQAEEHARALREKTTALAGDLEATRRPLARLHKDAASRMLDLTGESFAERNALAADLRTFLGAMGQHLDTDPPGVFMNIDTAEVIRSSPEGWREVEPRVFAPARSELQRILERGLGLRREESRRVLDGAAPATPDWLSAYAGEPPGVLLAATKKRAQFFDEIRARAMAAEDAYERLAPKTWLDDERRWFVTDQVPPRRKQEEPLLEASWTSWVLRQRPSSIDVLLTLCADPKNAVLAEDYALEACRFMAEWGWRTPRRVIWLAEPEPRFHAYTNARPFRERADTIQRAIVKLEIPAEARAHHAQRALYDEGKLRAKLDVGRAKAWPKVFEPIVEIWKLGYAISAVTDFGVVLLANAPKLEDLLAPLAS